MHLFKGRDYGRRNCISVSRLPFRYAESWSFESDGRRVRGGSWLDSVLRPVRVPELQFTRTRRARTIPMKLSTDANAMFVGWRIVTDSNSRRQGWNNEGRVIL